MHRADPGGTVVADPPVLKVADLTSRRPVGPVERTTDRRIDRLTPWWTGPAWAAHREGVLRLRALLRSDPRRRPGAAGQATSNLFRARSATGAPGLDVSGLAGVIEVDAAGAAVADVQGMCTYEDLVDATLPHGLIPLVVPQLRTITLGGAVTGLGIESTSFRNGLPHESVLEMDVFTGDGEIVTVKPGDALFDAFPNSYGSLGYATRLRIELERVPAYVELRHVRFDDLDRCAAAVAGDRRPGAVATAGRSTASTASCSRPRRPTSPWPLDRRASRARPSRLHRAGDLLPLAADPSRPTG